MDTIIRQIKRALLFPRTLPETEQYPETPITSIRRMILSSYGLIALNLKRQKVDLVENNLGQPLTGSVWEGSPFAQIEPAMGYQYGLPLLLVRETGVDPSGMYALGVGPFLVIEWNSALPNPIETFFMSNDWRSIFQNWTGQVRAGFYIQTQPEFQYSCSGSD